MIISDIETNELLPKVTKFHCAVIYDYSTNKYSKYIPKDFSKYLDVLEQEISSGGLVVGHNFINYDVPVLIKLAKLLLNRNFVVPKESIIDTLVLTRLIYSNVNELGKSKSHSLESWGSRLGVLKGDYTNIYKNNIKDTGESYTKGDEWKYFNDSMLTYNVQDVVVNKELFEKLLSNKYYFPSDFIKCNSEYFWTNCNQSINFEHKVAWLLAQQGRNGFPFNKEIIEDLYQELVLRRNELRTMLLKTFGSWYQATGPVKVPKVTRKYKCKKTGVIYQYTKEASFTPIEYIDFNPSSRPNICKKLQDFGWIPTKFTLKGMPIVDEEVLSSIQLSDLEQQKSLDLLIEWFLIQKRIGQMVEGNKSWLKYVTEDGAIHGYVNPNGAVTGRATHSFPNISQVPSVDVAYGKECRSAFGAEYHKDSGTGQPWVQVGIDASGLELRCLAHFMALFDKGDYANHVVHGDIHSLNQKVAGLPTRALAKTLIYCIIYGGGEERIGKIIGKGKIEGRELKDRFLKNTPALVKLKDAVYNTLVSKSKWVGNSQQVTWNRRYLIGLDGRKIYVRSPHSALNTLLQSAGALICKKWIVNLELLLIRSGYTHGWHGEFAFMAWIHDEIQIACKTKEIALRSIYLAKEAIHQVEKEFKFRCSLDSEGKIGSNWALCH